MSQECQVRSIRMISRLEGRCPVGTVESSAAIYRRVCRSPKDPGPVGTLGKQPCARGLQQEVGIRAPQRAEGSSGRENKEAFSIGVA